MFLLLNLLCYLVFARARSTPMHTDSDGGHNTEEEANLMRKSSKEEKRLETEFKEQAMEYAKLISKIG